jgi:hypothetical protein
VLIVWLSPIRIRHYLLDSDANGLNSEADIVTYNL